MTNSSRAGDSGAGDKIVTMMRTIITMMMIMMIMKIMMMIMMMMPAIFVDQRKQHDLLSDVAGNDYDRFEKT